MILRNLILLLLTVSCFAQNVNISPDCFFFATYTATGRSPTAGYHNTTGCVAWTVVYASTGFSALSLRLESAPGQSTPGTWATFSGTTQSGANPNTATTQAFTVMIGFNPWVSLNLTAVTGTGTITAYVYGYRAPFTFSSTAGGPTSNVNLTQVAGVGVSLGQALMAASIPVTLASNQTALSVASTTLCTSTATLSTSSSGSTQLIAGTAAQQIHICNLDISSDGGANIKLVYGTGSGCTTPTDLTPAFVNLTGFQDNFFGSIVGAASATVCLNQSAGSATQVLATYYKQ